MVFHKNTRSRLLFLLAIGLLILIAAIVWWASQDAISTGNAVPVTNHPYQQLAYTKLSQQGNYFVGDVYLLDVDTANITQLTQGGETVSMDWQSSDALAIIERPRGSVINQFLLNVNQGTMQARDEIRNPEYLAVERSPDAQLLVTEIIKSNTWESLGYTVIQLVDGHAETLFRLHDAQTLPQFLPDSETIVYDTDDQRICIHQVYQDVRNCIRGTNATLSPHVTPNLLAYTTQLNGSYQLCVAHIENGTFSHTECYDRNPYQITYLSWRP